MLAMSYSKERSWDKFAKRRRALGSKRVSATRAEEAERVRVAGKYGWLAIHLFMGHLSGVAMATPVLSGAIVKLSNEKIRKYHLARALCDPPAVRRRRRRRSRRRNDSAFTPPSALFLSSPFRAALFPPSLSFSFSPPASTTTVRTTVVPSGGYRRLPEMVPLEAW